MQFRYEKLEVTSLAFELIDAVHDIAKQFPPEEKFSLANQLRRAALSILLNIAEGSARNSKKDFARFITMALGSVTEVHAGLNVAKRREYISEQQSSDIQPLLEKIWFKLCALRKSQTT